jgi:hypothetical protein
VRSRDSGRKAKPGEGAEPAPVWQVGVSVPWTVAWSDENRFELRPSIDFPGFLDLVQIENPAVGAPRFAAMNITRHRRAMVHHLCHVCGKPTLRRDRYLFPAHSGGMVTLQDGASRYGCTVPGVHLACSRRAARLCPHLSGKQGVSVAYPNEEGRLVQRTDVLPGLEDVAASLPPRNDIVFSCYRLFGEAFSRRVERMING